MNLSHNGINSDLSENLRYLLSSTRSVLKYLNLSDNYLTDEAFQGLAITSYLKCLVLRNNNINNAGARAILAIITDNKNIRRIDLSKNKVGVKYMLDIDKLIEK